MVMTDYVKAAVTGRSRSDVLVKLGTEQRAGRIAAAGKLTLITVGPHAGEYAVPVLLLNNPRPATPAWTRPVIAIGTGLLGLSAFGLTVTWFLATLSGAALVAICLCALAWLAWLIKRGSRPRGATVTTTTTITWR